MFDPETKKEELARKKEEALAKTKLGPLSGGENGVEVPLDQIMDRDDSWVLSFRSDAAMRERYGVVTIEGSWKCLDKKEFREMIGEVRAEKLKPFWNKPL